MSAKAVSTASIVFAMVFVIFITASGQQCELTTIGAGGIPDTGGTAALCTAILAATPDFRGLICYQDCYKWTGLLEDSKALQYTSQIKNLCNQVRQQGVVYKAGSDCNTMVCTGGGADFVNAYLDRNEGTYECGGNSATPLSSGQTRSPAPTSGQSIQQPPTQNSQTGCQAGMFYASAITDGPSDARDACATIKKLAGNGNLEYASMCCSADGSGYAVCSGAQGCAGKEPLVDHNEDSRNVCSSILPSAEQTFGYSKCNCIGCHWQDSIADGIIVGQVELENKAPQVPANSASQSTQVGITTIGQLADSEVPQTDPDGEIPQVAELLGTYDEDPIGAWDNLAAISNDVVRGWNQLYHQVQRIGSEIVSLVPAPPTPDDLKEAAQSLADYLRSSIDPGANQLVPVPRTQSATCGTKASLDEFTSCGYTSTWAGWDMQFNNDNCDIGLDTSHACSNKPVGNYVCVLDNSARTFQALVARRRGQLGLSSGLRRGLAWVPVVSIGVDILNSLDNIEYTIYYNSDCNVLMINFPETEGLFSDWLSQILGGLKHTFIWSRGFFGHAAEILFEIIPMGIRETFQKAETQFVRDLTAALLLGQAGTGTQQPLSVWFSGHSRGGGLAKYAAHRLANGFPGFAPFIDAVGTGGLSVSASTTAGPHMFKGADSQWLRNPLHFDVRQVTQSQDGFPPTDFDKNFAALEAQVELQLSTVATEVLDIARFVVRSLATGSLCHDSAAVSLLSKIQGVECSKQRPPLEADVVLMALPSGEALLLHIAAACTQDDPVSMVQSPALSDPQGSSWNVHNKGLQVDAENFQDCEATGLCSVAKRLLCMHSFGTYLKNYKHFIKPPDGAGAYAADRNWDEAV